MKNSNKILLITILTILVIITGLIISSRIMVTRIPDRSMKYSNEDFNSKTLDLKGFNAIETSGVWQVDIQQGSEYSIVLHYPESEAGAIDVYTWDNQLHLDNDMEWQRRKTVLCPQWRILGKAAMSNVFQNAIILTLGASCFAGCQVSGRADCVRTCPGRSGKRRRL